MRCLRRLAGHDVPGVVTPLMSSPMPGVRRAPNLCSRYSTFASPSRGRATILDLVWIHDEAVLTARSSPRVSSALILRRTSVPNGELGDDGCAPNVPRDAASSAAQMNNAIVLLTCCAGRSNSSSHRQGRSRRHPGCRRRGSDASVSSTSRHAWHTKSCRSGLTIWTTDLRASIMGRTVEVADRAHRRTSVRHPRRLDVKWRVRPCSRSPAVSSRCRERPSWHSRSPRKSARASASSPGMSSRGRPCQFPRRRTACARRGRHAALAAVPAAIGYPSCAIGMACAARRGRDVVVEDCCGSQVPRPAHADGASVMRTSA